MIVSPKKLFDAAYGKYAVGAYNVNNAEQIIGLFRGCQKTKAPFILQITKSAVAYTDWLMIEGMIEAADRSYPGLVYATHFDHGDFEYCQKAIGTKIFSSVMIDASAMPYKKNIETTKKIVKLAHKAGIWVEAEVGQLGGVEDDIKVAKNQAHLTDPDQAVDFIRQTSCDSLACAIGTSHGPYKFTKAPKIHLEILKQISDKLSRYPLVVHGASSVPPSEVKRINAAGGKLSHARGVNPADYKKAANFGAVKINFDTDGRLVWTRVYREFFKKNPKEIDFRRPGSIFIEEYANFVAKMNHTVGSAGQLSKLKIK